MRWSRLRNRKRKDNFRYLGWLVCILCFVCGHFGLFYTVSLEDNSWKMFSLNDCFNYKLGLGKPEVRNTQTNSWLCSKKHFKYKYDLKHIKGLR